MAQRLIASSRSSRSRHAACDFLELGQLLVGAQVHRPEPLALPRSLPNRVSTCVRSGSGAPLLRPASSASPAGDVEVVGDRAGDLGEAPRRGLEARLRAGPRLARGREGFERVAGGAVGLGEPGLGLGGRRRRGAGLAASSTSAIRARRRGMNASGISASDLRSLCGGRAARCIPRRRRRRARRMRSTAVSRQRSRRGGGRHLGLAEQRLPSAARASEASPRRSATAARSTPRRRASSAGLRG